MKKGMEAKLTCVYAVANVMYTSADQTFPFFLRLQQTDFFAAGRRDQPQSRLRFFLPLLPRDNSKLLLGGRVGMEVSYQYREEEGGGVPLPLLSHPPQKKSVSASGIFGSFSTTTNYPPPAPPPSSPSCEISSRRTNDKKTSLNPPSPSTFIPPHPLYAHFTPSFQLPLPSPPPKKTISPISLSLAWNLPFLLPPPSAR